MSAELESGERRALAGAYGALALIIALTGAHASLGVGGSALERAIRDWLGSLSYVLVAAIVTLRARRTRCARGPWTLFAIGLISFAAGNLLWALWLEHERHPPIPSVCDVLWLAFYPLSYAGIVGVARIRDRRQLPTGAWLDGIVAGAGLAAVGAAAITRQAIVSATAGAAAVTTELVYPVCDLLLAALVIGVATLRGWRLDRVWALLGLGFVVLAVADCLHAGQLAGGSTSRGDWCNVLYVLGAAVLSVAAWQTDVERGRSRLTRFSVALVPAGFALTAIGLLLYDHWVRLDPLALSLSAVTLVAATLRMAITCRGLRTLADAPAHATADDLTSLPKRRGELARALQDGAIEVHYQPVCSVLARRIVAIEALVRWRVADGRLAPPGELIAAAEHAGLLRALTNRVLGLALEQLREWHAAGHALRVAVNTTVGDLLDVEFPASVARALAANGLAPESLVLELTESQVMTDPRRIAHVLAELRSLGVELSLDDFGTGYSSLTHLRELPVSEVKLDRSFVSGMRGDPVDGAIVQATIDLAHKLGIRVVAEGVEDEETWEALAQLGCELIQGYLISRPVAAAQLSRRLERPAAGRRAAAAT
ncbi:MAG: EAL domain-containing protein, partial [Solirubrobacteraceae bacterium]